MNVKSICFQDLYSVQKDYSETKIQKKQFQETKAMMGNRMIHKFLRTAILSILAVLVLSVSSHSQESICNCTDFIYTNDAGLGVVHKFAVDPATGALTEVLRPNGDFWLPPGTLESPHGLALDLNGNLYIANRFNNPDNFVGRLSCTGEFLNVAVPSNLLTSQTFNLTALDSVVYVPEGRGDEIRAFNVCTGDFIGSVEFIENNTSINSAKWGFYSDGVSWFASEQGTGDIVTGLLDPSLFTTPPTNFGTPLFSTGDDDSNGSSIMGLTEDAAGNFYVIGNQTIGGVSNNFTITKYDPVTGAVLAQISADSNEGPNLPDGVQGYFGARAIVYSQESDLLYVGNFENCITVFDTNLMELTTLNIGNPNGGEPKAINIVSECCPIESESETMITLCEAELGDVLFVADILPCFGTICEGELSLDPTSVGVSFDNCNNAITIEESAACGRVNFESDGTDEVAQCVGGFLLEIEIDVPVLEIDTVLVSDCMCGDEAMATIDFTFGRPCFPDDEVIVEVDGVEVDGSPFAVPMMGTATETAIANIPADGDERLVTARFASGTCEVDSFLFVSPMPCTPLVELDILGSPELSCKDSVIFEVTVEFFGIDIDGVFETSGTGMLTETEGSNGSQTTYIPGPGEAGEVLISFTVPTELVDCPQTSDTVAIWIIPDTTPPTFVNCPTAPFVISTSQCAADGAPLTFPIPVAVDDCSVDTMFQSSGPMLGEIVQPGDFEVCFEAVDCDENVAECCFNITVVDGGTDPLILACKKDWDACTDEGVCTFTTGDGDLNPVLAQNTCGGIQLDHEVTLPDGSIIAGMGNVPGGLELPLGVTEVCYTVTDEETGEELGTCCFNVTVEDKEAPELICPMDVTVECDGAGNAADLAAFLAGFTAMDNCDIPEVDAIEFNTISDCGPTNTTVYEFTATDMAGNTTTCLADFTIEDTTPPMAICVPTLDLELGPDGIAVITEEDIDNGSNDVCSAMADLDITISQTTFTSDDIGQTTVTLTVTDECGNSDTCETIVTLTGSTVLGLAKREVDAVLQDNGCFAVTYELNLENLGNTDIADIQVVEDLATAGFGTCGSFTATATSDDFQVNPLFDGAGVTDLLVGSDVLMIADQGAILVMVEACDCPNPSDIMNTATASGTGPTGDPVEDDSTDGSDPDPDGNGDPDEDDPTLTTLTQNPGIGLAKRTASVTQLANGCAEVVFEFNIQNTGNVDLNDVTLTDTDIAPNFGAACNSVEITQITSDDFFVNGDNADALVTGNLLQLTGNVLPVDDKGAVLVTVEACGCGDAMVQNSATTGATPPGGDPIEDISTDGEDPDPDGDGDPDGPGEDDPTMTDLSTNPNIGLAKRVSSIWFQDNGCALVQFEFNIENLGDVDLTNITLTDTELNAGFSANCQSVEIKELTSDDFFVNGDPVDALASGNLLQLTGSSLPVGDKGAVLLTVEACGCVDGEIENSASTSADTPSGEVIEDTSTDGPDPDPDGDGDADEDDETTVTPLAFMPGLGSAKRVVELTNNQDGSSTITYEFNIENFGNIDIIDLQLTDDFATAFAPCLVEVIRITSDDFTVNPLFNGATDFNLLTGGDVLQVGDKGAVLLTVNVNSCQGNTGPFDNIATASGEAPAGFPIEDMTTEGSDPDPNGDGVPDEDEPTTVEFDFNSEIGIAKNIISVVQNADGSTLVTYEFNIENFGNQELTDVQVTDNLGVVFAPCTTEVIELTSDDFTANNSGPTQFDGITNLELLTGTDIIGVGDQGAILLTVQLSDCGGVTGPFNNSAFISAEDPDGDVLTDISQNGPEPDPDGNGDPTDNNDPTPLDFGFDPALGASKRVSQGPFLNDDGCSDLVYEIKVENLGDVDINNIQVVEDLAATFGSAESFEVTAIESEEFTVNTNFDGVTDTQLLTGDDVLISVPAGDEGAIYVHVNVCPGSNPGPFNNTVVASGIPPDGIPVFDESTDGSDPDPNGDGVPDENEPTPVLLEFDPVIGLAKRLASIEMITDDCARVTYEFNIENLGNTVLENVQVVDDLAAAFGACSGDVSIFSITSDDFSVNADYVDAFATGNLLTGSDNLLVNDRGAILVTIDACTCGTSTIVNSAVVTGEDPLGDPVTDVSTDGSDPDPNGDGDPEEDEPTVHTITCTVAIICPDVHDPVNVQNDLEECGAIVNFPDARIESNCMDIDEMDIQFMLTPTDGSLPVIDPTTGAVVPYNVFITGQAGGLMYPVDTVLVTYRINPADLPTGIEAPILTPGECDFTVIVRDEQCPTFINTLPIDTFIFDCIIPEAFVLNAPWDLRDNCTDPEDIQVDFVETKFDSICPNTFTLKRVWTITDEAGNACEHNRKLFVRDTTPPTIILPPDTLIQECAVGEVILNCRDVFTPIDTVETQTFINGEWVINLVVNKDTTMVCDTIITPVPLSAGIPEVDDGACTPAELILVTFRDSVDLVCKGDKAAIVFRIWRAEDECGNVSEAIQEIEIIDPNPPILEVLPEVTISLGPAGHVNLTRDDIILNLFDACFTDMSDIDLVIEPNFFGCGDLGVHTVIVAATDPCNNRTAYEEVIVTIVDNEAPVLNCPTGTVTIDIDPMDCNTSFANISNILVDGDCDATLSTLPALDGGLDINTTEIVVTGTDASGNSSTCTVNVNINVTGEVDFESALVCNGDLNVSLGSKCKLELTPGQILEGEEEICSNFLCIEVFDANGDEHLNFFDESDINETFSVRVVDCNGTATNSCWSNVLIEEKQIPLVSFPQDTCILCVEPTDPEYHKLGLPIIENCETFIDIDFEDIYREFDDCSDPRAIIERRWVVSDDEGNVLRDTQEIAIKPFSTEHVVFPEDLALFNNNVINCADVTESRLDIETGNIAPTSVLHPDSTGLPNIFGLPLQSNAGLCLFSIGFEDRVLEICAGSFQILRLWEVSDVCKPFEEGVNPISATQVITVFDVDGPQVLDEPDPVTVSIDPWLCTFTGELSLPEVVQSCGGFEFEAYITGSGTGFIEVSGTVAEGNLSVMAMNVEEGSHWVTYVYQDGCSNIELFKFQLNVDDQIPPVAVCNTGIQVVASATSDGSIAKVFVESIDNGSDDSGCGPIKDRCVLRLVDFSGGSLGMIDGQLAYRAVNGCFQDGETIDTILDKNGDIESLDRVPFVFCRDFVSFCCSDIGVQEVVLVVSDESGLTNTCSTSVEISETSNVFLECVPQTIDCTDDASNTLVPPVGFDGLCAEEVSLSFSDDSELIDGCGEGRLIRTWFLDRNGNDTVDEGEVSCNQAVTVINATAFDPFTIKWPKHFTGEVFDGVSLECDEADNSLLVSPTSVTMGDAFTCMSDNTSGTPVWCETACGLIGLSSEIDTIAASDACLKLVKRWTLVDWCVFQANGNDVDDDNDGVGDVFQAVEDWAQGVCDDDCEENFSENPIYFRYSEVDQDGFYTYDQIINVVDDTPPSIEVEDVVVNIMGGATSKEDDTPCSGSETITATATDLCGDIEVPASLIRWSIIYENGAQATTSSAVGALASIETEAGVPGDVHTVIFTATDGCGNQSSETIQVTFRDDSAPVPICVSGVTTTFMESDGTATVWAGDFDAGSFDNCSELQFSIVNSGETAVPPSSPEFESQANLMFSCEEMSGFFELDVYVWDASDNGDFCTVGILIGGSCDGTQTGSSASITGAVYTEDNDMVENAIVTLEATGLTEFPKTTLTGNDGQYAFDNNPLNFAYSVSTSKNDDSSNGVTTLDILLIQRHILGIAQLDSPYKMIAADANNNQSISAADVLELRKMVLGLTSEFSNNYSWRFVNKESTFLDESNPWPFIESILYSELLTELTDQDFIAVKIGDVNSDVIANSLTQAEIRSSDKLLDIDDQSFVKGEEVTIPIFANEINSFEGLQFTMSHEGLSFEGLQSGAIEVDLQHIGVHDENVTFSWESASEIVQTNEVLFELIFTALKDSDISNSIQINSSITKSEIYNQGEVSNLGLQINDVGLSSAILYQNDPNPFKSNTTIKFELPTADQATLIVYDVNGKELVRIGDTFKKGIHEITIDEDKFPSAGLYYYRLTVDNNFIGSKKMMLIK